MYLNSRSFRSHQSGFRASDQILLCCVTRGWRPSAKMSSSALIVSPSHGNSVEPLLDYMWHYECVVSPRSTKSCASNVQSPTGERSPLTNHSEGEGKTKRPSYIELLDGFQAVKSKREKGCSSVLNNPESIPGDGELNAGSARSSRDLSISAMSGRRGPSESKESLTPLKCKELEISSGEFNILGADRKWLHRVFDTFDENGDGKISKDELRRCLEKLGIYMPDECILSLLSSVSLQTEGLVNSNEFFLLYQTSCTLIDDLCEEAAPDVDKDLLEAFNIFDTNKDGFISATELQAVLRSLGFPQAGDFTVCEEMIRRVDENGKGKIDFFEFKKLMISPSAPLAAF